MQLKYKKLHPGAVAPRYGTPGSACFDLPCLKADGVNWPCETVEGEENYPPSWSWLKVTIPTGLSFEIPEGHVMLIFPRSGLAFNQNINLANSVGVVDSDFRGQVQVQLVPNSLINSKKLLTLVGGLKNGDRIAQAMIVPYPKVSFEEAPELSDTQRGSGGFGSTGLK
jgi:dUTP pyrophosphatase